MLQVIVHRADGVAFSTCPRSYFPQKEVDDSDEYDVKHSEADENSPSVSSCWLESEQDAVSATGT